MNSFLLCSIHLREYNRYIQWLLDMNYSIDIISSKEHLNEYLILLSKYYTTSTVNTKKSRIKKCLQLSRVLI